MLVYRFHNYGLITKYTLCVAKLNNRFYAFIEDENGKWFNLDELNISRIEEIDGTPEILVMLFTNSIALVAECLNLKTYTISLFNQNIEYTLDQIDSILDTVELDFDYYNCDNAKEIIVFDYVNSLEYYYHFIRLESSLYRFNKIRVYPHVNDYKYL